jgi:hypothetical protein
MRMLEQFSGRRFNLSLLGDLLRAKPGSRYTMEIIRNDAHVETHDFTSTFIIAEFMLNLVPLPVPPSEAAIDSYIRSHFTPIEDRYSFSCHEDILQIGVERGQVGGLVVCRAAMNGALSRAALFQPGQPTSQPITHNKRRSDAVTNHCH